MIRIARTVKEKIHLAAGCLGKERFNTWKEAERIVGRKRGHKQPMKRNVYRCRFCQGYHVGTASE